jgi:hypothetical protein
MTTIEIIVLIVGVFLFAGVLGFGLSQGGKDEPEVETFSEYTTEEARNIKAAEEAYNKPVVDIEVNEPEFVAKETTPQVEDLVVKATGSDEAAVVVELSVEKKAPKSEFPIDKPKAKKKYPRKKKPSKVQE